MPLVLKAQGLTDATQAFNTTTSMGRLTLNMLLSFARFEREVTSERIRDKIAGSKKKGMWMGGNMPLGQRLSILTSGAHQQSSVCSTSHRDRLVE